MRGEVRFDAGSRALYATDSSNYRQVPIGLVIPLDEADVVATIAACREAGAPILPRGAGTSLAGQCCNVAVIMDFSKYLNRIITLDPGEKVARVQPGIVLDRVRDAAEVHQLTFAPDPATHSRCTLGGMIGNNSCGVHALMGGKTVDNIHELDVMLYDGTRMTVGKTSDAELDAIIRAGGRKGADLRRAQEHSRSVRAAHPREVSAHSAPRVGLQPRRAAPGKRFQRRARARRQRGHVRHGARSDASPDGEPAVQASGLHRVSRSVHRRGSRAGRSSPTSRSASKGSTTRFPIRFARRACGSTKLKLLPEGKGVLLVEFGAWTSEDVDAQAEQFGAWLATLTPRPKYMVCTPQEAAAVWHVRESALGAVAIQPGKRPGWEGWEDSAVPPDRLGSYLRAIYALMREYNYDSPLYGHFGEGCVHMRIDFDLQTEPGIQQFREFIDRATDIVVAHGGSISGEHGDGQSRGALLPKMFGPELMEGFREFKRLWDPDNRMNPGKLIDARQPHADLRLGADYAPRPVETHFRFPNDDGSLANATLRCVGVGACRKEEGGAMCPSYMATREEKHSTRGRAHLLWELLQGEVLEGGWQNEEVKDALDLCLSCKACKTECPTNVDLATYKAEFLVSLL